MNYTDYRFFLRLLGLGLIICKCQFCSFVTSSKAKIDKELKSKENWACFRDVIDIVCGIIWL